MREFFSVTGFLLICAEYVDKLKISNPCIYFYFIICFSNDMGGSLQLALNFKCIKRSSKHCFFFCLTILYSDHHGTIIRNNKRKSLKILMLLKMLTLLRVINRNPIYFFLPVQIELSIFSPTFKRTHNVVFCYLPYIKNLFLILL